MKHETIPWKTDWLSRQAIPGRLVVMHSMRCKFGNEQSK